MSSGFITESELAEIKKRRQEEWEKVRKPDDPLERPEDSDTRSLYERLEEEKRKKQLEFEEAHKLKNMIRGLDDDDIDFLNTVDKAKLEQSRKIELEEEKELRDYRNKVSNLNQKHFEEKLKNELSPDKKTKNASSSNEKLNQRNRLKGVIIKKRKMNEDEQEKNEEESVEVKQEKNGIVNTTQSLECVAVLPGLASYDETYSSSDIESSDSDLNDLTSGPSKDLFGRILLSVPKKKNN